MNWEEFKIQKDINETKKKTIFDMIAIKYSKFTSEIKNGIYMKLFNEVN